MKVAKLIVDDVEQTKRQYLHPNATASTHTSTTTIKATATTINSAATTTFATTQAKGIKDKL